MQSTRSLACRRWACYQYLNVHDSINKRPGGTQAWERGINRSKSEGEKKVNKKVKVNQNQVYLSM